MRTPVQRRGPHRSTVLLVVSLVGALMIGTAGGAVGAGLITSKQIKNGTIKNVDIKKNTITGKKIKNGSLASADIRNGTIRAKDIKAGSLTGALVKDGSLSGSDLAYSSITGQHVADGALTGADLAAGTVAGSNIAAGAIENDHLAADARLWAVVNWAGFLDRSSGGVTTEKKWTGGHEVTFPVAVDQCAPSVTGMSVPVSVQTVLAVPGEPQKWLVVTFDLDGNSVDRGFTLVVHC